MNINKTITLHFDEDTFKTKIAEVVNEAFKDAFSKHQAMVANGDPDELFTREQVKNKYGVSYVTLRDWEQNGIIPKPIRKGGRVYWRNADIIADIQQKGGKNDR